MTASAEQNRALDQQIFDEWPVELRALFDGSALASKVGFTASLLTVDESGAHLRTSGAEDLLQWSDAQWDEQRAARAKT